LDVTGSYGAQQEAPILLDARNADELTVEVYRAAAAEELVWVAERIGTDFIFRDHSLQYVQDDQRRSHEIEKFAMDVQRVSRLRRDGSGPLPPSLRGEPVCRWTCAIGSLPLFQHRDEERFGRHEHDDEESSYFGDDCGEFRHRLRKDYRPEAR